MGVIETSKKYLADTYGREDVIFYKGKGATLTDIYGEKYIDFGCGIAVNGLGTGFRKWKRAVKRQIGRIAHASNLFYTQPAAELAKLLCKRTGMKKAFFSNSGAEANECAIKTARKYSFDKYGENRAVIVTLENSFHGRTVTALSATGQEAFHQYFMPFTEGFRFVPANDAAAMEAALTDDVCAVMLELVQGEGGVIALDKEYVQAVEKLCKKKDILLMIDEVQTGNGRTGTLYAFQQYGVSPDVITTAKGLGNGLPVGATLFSAKCEKTLTPGTHGSTFGGNPAACAGAVAVIKSINDKLLKGVEEKALRIRETLLACSKVKSVSGLGLMIGAEVENAAELKKQCLQKGLVVLTAKDRLRLLPPLNIGNDELERGLAILREVLK